MDNHQRLSIKQARPVSTLVEQQADSPTIGPPETPRERAVEETLTALIFNLRESGILES